MPPAPPARRFRIGVLGAGGVGAAHVRAAVGAPGLEIAAICDTDRRAARSLAETAAVPAYDDHRAMFAEAGLDAVVIAAPHALHAPLTVEAARAGLHVLVEKPMATTDEDCALMARASAEAGTLLAVAHVIHFDPVVREARALIASGRYGQPLLLTHRRSSHYEPGSRPPWFFDRAVAGGGIVLNVGTHGIDRIQLFADSAVRRVSGVVRGRPGLDVETDALALVELGNGINATLALTSRGMPYVDETEVVLDEATLRISAAEGLFVLRGGRATHLLGADPGHQQQAFRDQLRGFVTAARGGAGHYVDGAYGRSVVAAALAVYDSAARGRQVEVADERVAP
ncbi:MULTISPECIES: Gfo/Idh/MocA family protein [unclassified Streptomyces]|uniref:Gfo/Idh/MocA family protein n=1 Tax=unclassified Streptomyces TaxID=2593676 RepID=UPI0037FB6175